MSNRNTKSPCELNQFDNSEEISSEFVSQQLEQLEMELLKKQTKFYDKSSPNLRHCFERTQKMLSFARDNYEKGFINVSNSCLKLAENYLERCR